MAAKENQGLLISLITFVMLTIALSVSTFMFFRKLEEEQVKSKALNEKANKADEGRQAAENDSKEMKRLLGSKADDTVAQIQDQYAKDMKAYGESFPEAPFKQDQLNYRNWVTYLYAEMRSAKARIATNAEVEAELKAKIAADEATKKKDIATYTDTVAQTGKDLEELRAKFNQDRDEFKKSAADVAKKLDDRRKEFEEFAKKTEAEKAESDKVRTKLVNAIEKITTKEAENTALSERADGQITRVDQKARVVWLNLGSDDGLRRQTSFSVLGGDETDPIKAKRKGSIEVTRVLNQHMAEARIIDDHFENPLMAGDQLFSPVWHPGRVERFAIAGFIDIDGDKRSDLKLVRNLIETNGGVIDAYVDDDGKKFGEVTANTKYLVLGDAPTEDKKGSETVQGYSKIRGEAQTLGVRTMSVREFLDYMGYEKIERTVALGRGASSSDFPAKPPAGMVRKSNNEMFKPRRATPTGNVKSAY